VATEQILSSVELVPRLHVEEIKGHFAPPPWGMLQMLLKYFFFFEGKHVFSLLCSLIVSLTVFL